MIDLEEKLRSGLDFGRPSLSAGDLEFNGYGSMWVAERYPCMSYYTERSSLDTT